jgi:hypothetical protein
VVSEDVRTTVLLVALAGLVAALFFLLSSPKDEGAGAPAPILTAERSPPRARAKASGHAPAELSRGEPSKKTSAEREAMRRQIVDALQARADQAADGEAAALGGHDAHDGRAEGGRDDDTAPTPGDLKDRSGNHGYLLKVMNEELMPLADECYALARDTNPELEGLLVLDIDIIGDEEIGGVIEAVRPGEANELVDPNLLECMRESLFATTLPQPEESGRDAISLSMPLGPDDPPGDS